MIMTKAIYKVGRLVKQIEGTTWQFEVDSKLYENDLAIALDVSFPENAVPGMFFQISELALEASDLVEAQ